MFLILIVVGLVGLLAMAIPAFGHTRGGHGAHAAMGRGGGHAAHAAIGRGGAIARGGALSRGGVLARGGGGSRELLPANVDASNHPSLLRFIPSPRAICSVLALYGAFGNVLVHAHVPFLIAAIVAAIPALLVERFAVRPVWNLVFRFQGEPSTPLEQLMFTEARAVVAFRNGRGLVSTVRDGRRVQFIATLRDDQRALPVKVGERLVVEEVDAKRESVTVSIPSAD